MIPDAPTLAPVCPPAAPIFAQGPSYWRAHLHEASFYLREFDDESKKELENGEAHAVYTTDGSRPDCMHGIVYEWGSPVTVYNTSLVTAGVCAAGTFSQNLKKVNLVVITPHLHSHYPIFWLSQDRHCARIDAPMAAFKAGPNKMKVTMADGYSSEQHKYASMEHHEADEVGPESVLACGKDRYPEDALYGWAISNRAAGREKGAAARGQNAGEGREVRHGVSGKTSPPLKAMPAPVTVQPHHETRSSALTSCASDFTGAVQGSSS